MINELKIEHLKCNHFNPYEFEDLTMTELLCKFFTTINEVIKEHEDVKLNVEWLKEIGLAEETAKTLQKWLIDGTLTEIINEEIFKELDDRFTAIHAEINKIDLNQNPIMYTGIRGKETSVMQDFHILKSGNILMSQIAPSSTAETESFTISMTTVKGDIINYMTIKNGGHGNFTVYETDCQNIFILYSDNFNNLRKIEYIPGLRENEDGEILFRATTERVYSKINNDENLIALTYKNNQGEYYCTSIFNLENYITGVSYKPLYHIVHGQIGTFQGSAVDTQFLYLYYGLVNELIQIVRININTLERTDFQYPYIVNATNSENTTTEAEGACISNGILYVGVSLGEPTILRENTIFAFLPVNKIMNPLNKILNNVQMYKLTEASGTAKSFQHNNKLSNINSPGEYYFTAAQFKLITDVPEYLKDVDSGYFLHVSAKAKDGALMQTITRNTLGVNRYVLSRALTVDKTPSEWTSNVPERKTLFSGTTTSSEEVLLNQSIFDFDFINIRVNHAGGYSSHMLYCNDYKGNAKIILQGFNITDSPGNENFYPWELHISVAEDGRTLTQVLKSELVITGSGTNTRRTATCGIQNVQGIRGFNALPYPL